MELKNAKKGRPLSTTSKHATRSKPTDSQHTTRSYKNIPVAKINISSIKSKKNVPTGDFILIEDQLATINLSQSSSKFDLSQKKPPSNKSSVKMASLTTKEVN